MPVVAVPVAVVPVAVVLVVVTGSTLLDRSARVNEGEGHECLAQRSDEITGAVEVVEGREDKPITTLRTSVTRGDGTVVLDGTAVCYTMSLE